MVGARVSNGVPIARYPTVHLVLPRSEEVLRPLPAAAGEGLPHGTFPAAHLLLHGAGEHKELVIAPGVRVQLRQEQPPHASILEGCRLVGTPYFSHQKDLPCFSRILCPPGKGCKACFQTTTTPREVKPVSCPHTVSFPVRVVQAIKAELSHASRVALKDCLVRTGPLHGDRPFEPL
jgi:hypothetical protein